MAWKAARMRISESIVIEPWSVALQVTLPDTHFVALTSLLFSNHQDHENNGFKVRKSTYSSQNGWTGLHFWCFEDKVFGTSTIQNFCPRSNPLRMVCNRAEACEEVKFMSKADDPNCLMQSVGQIVVQDLIGFIWFNCKMTIRLRGLFILRIWVSLVSPKSPNLQVSKCPKYPDQPKHYPNLSEKVCGRATKYTQVFHGSCRIFCINRAKSPCCTLRFGLTVKNEHCYQWSRYPWYQEMQHNATPGGIE